MALDSTGLFTVIGKYVKSINTWNAYISSLETLKDEIFDKLEDEGLQDLYVDLPAQFLGFKNAVGSWIQSLIAEVEDILLDEDYVTDELPIYQRDVTSVLNAIYDYMVENSLTIESSVVTIAGSDTNIGSFSIDSNSSLYSASAKGKVYVSRTLDGLSNPSSTVTAHQRYAGAESQLAMSCTHLARVVSNTEEAEVVQLFCEVDAQAPYGPTAEKPGNGPTLTNATSLDIIPLNSGFDTAVSDTPTGWTVTGGTATTDWTTASSIFTIKTDGVAARQQLTGLSRYQMYFYGVYMYAGNIVDGSQSNEITVTVENVGGSPYSTSVVTMTDDYIPTLTHIGNDYHYVAYGFFYPNEEFSLEDYYLKIQMTAQTDAGFYAKIDRAVVCPVTYYNGLAHAYFSPICNPDLNDYGSIAIANNNNGVFQTFFRRAFNIQLPTADSSTIDDALAS